MSHFKFSCVQVVTDLEHQTVRRNRGVGGSICIMFASSLVKVFQMVPVRKSFHEPIFLHTDLG